MNGLYLLLVATSVVTAYVVPIEDCILNQDCLNVIGCADTLHLPDDSNCHKFFKCAAGRACPMECPRFDNDFQLVFNPVTQTCDWPMNVPNRPNCNLQPLPPVSSSTTQSSTPSTATPSTATPSTATPSTATPSTATPSTATPSTATPSTATPSTATPSTATPSSTASSSTASSSTTQRQPGVIPADCNNVNGRKRLQYEKDCNHYYQVVNDKKVLKECTTGLFNCVIEACDRPENVPWCTDRF